MEEKGVRSKGWEGANEERVGAHEKREWKPEGTSQTEGQTDRRPAELRGEREGPSGETAEREQGPEELSD